MIRRCFVHIDQENFKWLFKSISRICKRYMESRNEERHNIDRECAEARHDNGTPAEGHELCRQIETTKDANFKIPENQRRYD